MFSQNTAESNLLEQHNSEDDITDTNNEDDDDFEGYLRTYATNSSQNSQNSISTLNSSQGSNSILNSKLEDFGNISRLSYKKDIVNFWSENKNEMPELYQLAQILMAVPATQVLNFTFIIYFLLVICHNIHNVCIILFCFYVSQYNQLKIYFNIFVQVSMERSFSGLKFILSDLRNAIGHDILENILIIRGNANTNQPIYQFIMLIYLKFKFKIKAINSLPTFWSRRPLLLFN